MGHVTSTGAGRGVGPPSALRTTAHTCTTDSYGRIA